jgi:hypothetical protein
MLKGKIFKNIFFLKSNEKKTPQKIRITPHKGKKKHNNQFFLIQILKNEIEKK